METNDTTPGSIGPTVVKNLWKVRNEFIHEREGSNGQKGSGKGKDGLVSIHKRSRSKAMLRGGKAETQKRGEIALNEERPPNWGGLHSKEGGTRENPTAKTKKKGREEKIGSPGQIRGGMKPGTPVVKVRHWKDQTKKKNEGEG